MPMVSFAVWCDKFPVCHYCGLNLGQSGWWQIDAEGTTFAGRCQASSLINVAADVRRRLVHRVTVLGLRPH